MSLAVACIEFELYLPYAHSLKDKRQLVHRLRDRARAQFPVLVVETAHQESWQRAGLALILAGSERRVVEAQVNQLRDFCVELLPGELSEFHWAWR